MKLLSTVFCLLFFSLEVYANTLNNNNEVGDLMYFPEVDTYYSGVSYSIYNSSEDLIYQSKNLSTSDVQTTKVNAFISRAITEKYGWGIQIPYVLSNKQETKFGEASTLNGQTKDYKSNGMEDIVFMLRYKFKEQSDQSHKIHLEFEFSPNTGDAENASSKKDGNEFRGGTKFSLAASLGKKYNNFSYSFGVNIAFLGESKSRDLSDNTTTKKNSYKTASFGGITQLVLTPQTYLTGGLTFTQTEDFKTTSDSSTTEYDYSPYFTTQVGIGHRLSPQSTFEFIYSIASPEGDITSGTTAFTREIDHSGITFNYNWEM